MFTLRATWRTLADTALVPGGEQDALAEERESGAAERLALDHIKS
jgi:hypothetical protein